MSQRSITLLVTVGSTLFPALTDAIFSTSILLLLSELGVTKLLVQYGKATLPSSLSNMEVDALGIGITAMKGMEVEVMRYTDDFEGLIKSCDAVISHAGSGTILSVLRQSLPPSLLIVPNESLMDNHQSELADELGKEGYLMVSKVNELKDKLPVFLTAKRASVKPFPAMNGDRFRTILDETMGYL